MGGETKERERLLYWRSKGVCVLVEVWILESVFRVCCVWDGIHR